MDYSKIISELGKKRVKLNELMAKHTTFKIGGPADLFYEAKTEKELIGVIRLIREIGVPYFLLGGGSNILVSDKGIRGLVIKIQNTKYKILDTKIVAGAGISLGRLVEIAKENSLTGLEFAAGIPGTLGGAIRGNAGAWLESIGEKVLRVKILTSDDQVRWVKGLDCQFAYRQSRFKKSKEIILVVELGLGRGDKDEIQERIDENLKKRKAQPKQPSAGCIFVNPKPNSAGRLIEKVGLKGRKVGNAQISPKHANFIVNLGGATCEDVLKLIALAKKEVKKKFGIELKEEIEVVGESC